MLNKNIMTSSYIYNYIKPMSFRIPLRVPSLIMTSLNNNNNNKNKNKNIYKIRFNNNNSNNNEFDLYKYRLFTLKVCLLYIYVHYFLSFHPYYNDYNNNS